MVGMAETAREGKAREPLSGTVSGQPDKILHGNPAQAAGRGFLHGIHRLYRRESHKGREQGGSDNLLLAFYGVPERLLPPAEELLEKQPEETCRYMLKCGGVTEGNPVPLRRAVYLRAHGREINRTGLKEMEHSPGYRNYEAYEAAMERLSEGKKASFRLTFVKTERGVRGVQ